MDNHRGLSKHQDNRTIHSKMLAHCVMAYKGIVLVSAVRGPLYLPEGLS